MFEKMTHPWRLRACTVALFFLSAVTHGFADRPSAPIALHPDNPHYFIWRGEPTILITSGEHYGALLNLDLQSVLRSV